MSRIVLMPSAYLPGLGGVEELTRHLALALVEAGDIVEVWTMQSDRLAHPTIETLDGLTIRRFPYPLPNARPRSFMPFARGGAASIKALREAVVNFRPDILHVQCFGPNGVYATVLSRITGVPLIISLQGETMMDDHDIFETSFLLRAALRIGLRRAACVTACSAFTRADAESRFGLAAGRGLVIFNGVAVPQDTGAADSGTASQHVGHNRYILALGRVVEKKGFDLLIRSFAEVARKHPDVHLAIGGDGHSLATLRNLAANLGVADRVSFLGRLSRTEVAAAMASAELFVMPSRLEPFGIVILEAWRASRAVLCTSIGGPPEFVEDGKTGLLADPFDMSAMSSALDRLLSDTQLRTAIGAAGRIRVGDFAWPTIADRYRQHYAAVSRT